MQGKYINLDSRRMYKHEFQEDAKILIQGGDINMDSKRILKMDSRRMYKHGFKENI